MNYITNILLKKLWRKYEIWKNMNYEKYYEWERWKKLFELTRQFEITPTKSATLPIVRTPTHSYNAVVLAMPNYWHNSETFNHWVLIRSYLQLVKKGISFLSWFVAKRFRQLPGCGLRCWLRRADAIPRRLKLLSTTTWIF